MRGPGVGTLVSRAWSGDTEAARAVLGLFCEAVERGDQVPTPILQYFAGKFRKLLADKRPSADEILGLKRQHRPKSQRKINRDAEIVGFVLAARRGATRKKSVLKAAEHFHVSKTTVENALRDHADDPTFSDTRRAITSLFPAERAALRIRLPKKPR